MPWLFLSILFSTVLFFIGFYPGWFDSSEFVLAAQTLGVSHPSGHPFWVLWGKTFSFLPLGAIAFRTGLLSALATVSTLGIFYQWLYHHVKVNRWVSTVACCCVLLHPSIGLQTTRTEVYSLTLLLIVASFYFSNLAILKQDLRFGFFSFFIGGLSITLQPLLAITIFPILFYSLFLYSKKSPSVWGLLFLFFLLGCSIDLFMPLRAMTHPLLNWDEPSTFSALYKSLTARDFREFFHGPLSGKARSDFLRGDLFTLLPLPLLTLSFIGFTYFFKTQKRFASLALIALISTTLPWLLKDFYLRNPDAHAYVMAPILFLIAFAALGSTRVLSIFLPPGFIKNGAISFLILTTLGPLLSLSLPALSSRGEDVYRMTRAIQTLPPNSLITAGSDHWLFPTWYFLQVENQRPDVQIIAPEMLKASWYRNQVIKRLQRDSENNQFDELTNLKLHPDFLQQCSNLFHQNDPFGINQAICAKAIDNDASQEKQTLDKQAFRLETALQLPPTNLICKTGEPAYFPYPLIPDSQTGFLVTPDFNYVALGNIYLQCKQPLFLLLLAQREPQIPNLRLLAAFAELKSENFSKSLEWIESGKENDRVSRGYFSLARASIHFLLKQMDQAKEELHASKRDLGHIEPVLKLEKIIQSKL